MAAWMAVYVFSASWIHPEPGGVPWHAHEMVFGYAMAVVAGFLLTAVGNWTGAPGLRGPVLAGLLAAWGTAQAALILPMQSRSGSDSGDGVPKRLAAAATGGRLAHLSYRSARCSTVAVRAAGSGTDAVGLRSQRPGWGPFD